MVGRMIPQVIGMLPPPYSNSRVALPRASECDIAEKSSIQSASATRCERRTIIQAPITPATHLERLTRKPATQTRARTNANRCHIAFGAGAMSASAIGGLTETGSGLDTAGTAAWRDRAASGAVRALDSTSGAT